MNNEEMVTISKKEYNKLRKDSEWLNWLNIAGIDNTDAYCYAQDLRSEAEGAQE